MSVGSTNSKDNEITNLKRESLNQVDEKTEVSRGKLEALLRRKDVWRGYSQAFVAQKGLDTGFDTLNNILLHKGWPEACLIELGQASFSATWFLMANVVKTLLEERGGVIAVLNPPATPYVNGLLRMGVPTRQLIVVNPKSKCDFVACFVELSRSQACNMLMAWQPKQKLSYSELRKCQLATNEQSGVYCLFRHSSALSQTSPASLRIELCLRARNLALKFVKQRGCLPGKELELALPSGWFIEKGYTELNELDGQRLTSWEEGKPLHAKREFQVRENRRAMARKT